jgi:hypothetical protein
MLRNANGQPTGFLTQGELKNRRRTRLPEAESLLVSFSLRGRLGVCRGSFGFAMRIHILVGRVMMAWLIMTRGSIVIIMLRMRRVTQAQEKAHNKKGNRC